MKPKQASPVVAAIAGILVVLGLASPAAATWSIVAVDAEGGLVGAAMASCVSATVLGNPDEVLVPIVLVPGSTAAVVQGSIEPTTPSELRGLLNDGALPQQAIDLLLEDDPQASSRQYAVVAGGPGRLEAAAQSGDGPTPVGAAQYTGSDTESIAADAIVAVGPTGPVAVQGFLLEQEAVVANALEAYVSAREAGRPLARALADGLVAGSEAGGDRRCGDQTALFAHVAVAEADDDPGRPSLVLTVLVDEGDGQNPVVLLDRLLDEGQFGWQDLGRNDPVGVPRIAALAVATLLGLAAFVVLRSGFGNRRARR